MEKLSPEELMKEITSSYNHEHPLENLLRIMKYYKGKTVRENAKEVFEDIENDKKLICSQIINESLDLTEQIPKDNAKSVVIAACKLQDMLSSIIGLTLDSYYNSDKDKFNDIVRAYCEHSNGRFLDNLKATHKITDEINNLIDYEKERIIEKYGMKPSAKSQHPNNFRDTFMDQSEKVIKAVEAGDFSKKGFVTIVKAIGSLNRVMVTYLFYFSENIKSVTVGFLLEKYLEDNEKQIKAEMKSLTNDYEKYKTKS